MYIYIYIYKDPFKEAVRATRCVAGNNRCGGEQRVAATREAAAAAAAV